MTGMKVTKKKLLRRLEWLCKFFKEVVRGTGPAVLLGAAAKHESKTDEEKMPKELGRPRGINSSRGAKPLKRFHVKLTSDSAGNVIYPVKITDTLKILSLGVINW